MTDYGNVRSAATALVERFTDLEVDHQANRAFSTYAEQNPDAHDWTHEEKLEKLQIWSDQWRGEIRSWFADIEDLFDDLADFPEPGPLRSRANQFTAALSQMAGPSGHTDISESHEYSPSAAFEQLSVIDTKLKDWTALTISAFKDNFIPPLERVVHNQFEAIVSLRGPMLASAAMWEKARPDVCNLIDASNAALNSYEGQRNPGAESFALGLIGAIIAVAAVPFTGGTSAMVYWAIASASFSVAGAAVALPNEPEKELQIKGDWPADMAESLREEIGKLRMQLLEDEIFIRDQIRTLADLLAGYTAPPGTPPRPRDYPPYGGGTDPTYRQDTVHEFTMPRPDLADLPESEIPDGFGEPEA